MFLALAQSIVLVHTLNELEAKRKERELMDIMYWTFPDRSGKWSIAAGMKDVLACGLERISVYWTDTSVGLVPIIVGNGVQGTRWLEGPAVQKGVPPPAPGGSMWPEATKMPEKSGGSVDYYKVAIATPTSGGEPYVAECNDIIEALGMNYSEGNAFKAIWRSCAARTLGKEKAGGDALYDAEKVVFFGNRMIVQRKGQKNG